ncbi:MAG: hypothetical protein II916_09985, partial [Oscillospiraceae bacterium]|nr:hypothetical protein [Oscillospiraceae bacterium]
QTAYPCGDQQGVFRYAQHGRIKGDGLSVSQYHLFIHSMLAMAFKENLIPRNYASAATPPKRDQKEVEALPEDDINAFFNALYADKKHYMYQVMPKMPKREA